MYGYQPFQEAAYNENCECFRILTPGRPQEWSLIGLKHVCDRPMRLSCQRWVWAAAPVLVPGSREMCQLPVGDGRVTVPIDPWKPRWPIPIQQSPHSVALVLQQWVEHREEKLMRTLDEMPAWHAARRWVGMLGNCPLKMLPDERAWWGKGLSSEALNFVIFCYRVLRLYGLPATPGTAEYLLSRVSPAEYTKHFGRRAACPTRGILVRSLALIPGADMKADHGDMVWNICPSAEWTTDSLRRDALKLAHSHREWWKGIPRAQLPRGDLRKHNRREPDELTELIDAYTSGDLDPKALVKEALGQEQHRLGRGPSPMEKRKFIRKLNARIARKKPSR